MDAGKMKADFLAHLTREVFERTYWSSYEEMVDKGLDHAPAAQQAREVATQAAKSMCKSIENGEAAAEDGEPHHVKWERALSGALNDATKMLGYEGNARAAYPDAITDREIVEHLTCIRDKRLN